MSMHAHQLEDDDAIDNVQWVDLFGRSVRIETTRKGIVLMDGVRVQGTHEVAEGLNSHDMPLNQHRSRVNDAGVS
jgi:hypothetical protein